MLAHERAASKLAGRPVPVYMAHTKGATCELSA